MARHQGIISLSGKVGDLIFVNRNGKRYAKSTSTEPVNLSEASKKSGSDFGEASRSASKVRKAFAPLIAKYGDDMLVNRLNKRMIEVFKTVPSEFAGNKKLGQGNIGLLQGFRFNSLVPLDTLLQQPPLFAFDQKGQLQIELVAAPSNTMFKQIAKATAIVLQLMVYNLDLNDEENEVIPINDLVIPLANHQFQGGKLNVELNLNGERAALVGLGKTALFKFR